MRSQRALQPLHLCLCIPAAQMQLTRIRLHQCALRQARWQCRSPAAQTPLPSSSPADGETLYPEGMSKQERKRAKRKAQKLKAQEQEQEADDIEQDHCWYSPSF